MADNPASSLSVATALFFTWSLLTFGVRAWVKLRRSERWGWDDSAITTALAFALLHVICVFLAIHHGYGQAFSELEGSERSVTSKAVYASQFFYIASIGLSKVSTGLFIGHLTRHGPQAKRAYILSAVCGLWTIASMFVVGLRGDLQHPENTLDGSNTLFVRWIVIEATGLAVEVALWSLSIIIIWNLSMALSKRCTILAIFGCRLLLIPLVALRLWWLSPDKNPQPDIPNITTDILTEAVLQFAFISASVTCLKPFLKPFASTFTVSSVGNSGNGWASGLSGNNKEPYYALSAIQAEKGGALVSATSDSTNLSASKSKKAVRKSFRPDTFEQETTVSTSSHKDSTEGGDDGTDPMIIRKTETWSVRIEDGGSQPVKQDNSSATAQSTIHE